MPEFKEAPQTPERQDGQTAETKPDFGHAPEGESGREFPFRTEGAKSDLASKADQIIPKERIDTVHELSGAMKVFLERLEQATSPAQATEILNEALSSKDLTPYEQNEIVVRADERNEIPDELAKAA